HLPRLLLLPVRDRVAAAELDRARPPRRRRLRRGVERAGHPPTPARGLSVRYGPAGMWPLALVVLCATPTRAPAQQQDLRAELLESQRRLEQIRAERERLEAEVGDVRNRVRDISQELANVERRLSATMAVLAEVDFQTEATSEQI